MKKKNSRKIAAGVLAAALVLQSTAMTALPAFAEEADRIQAATSAKNAGTLKKAADDGKAEATPQETTTAVSTEAAAATTAAKAETTPAATKAAAATTAAKAETTPAATEAAAATTAAKAETTPAATEAAAAATEAKAETTTTATETETTAPTEPTTPETTEPVADDITLTGGAVVPEILEQGSVIIVKGTVASAVSEIISVEVGIYDSEGNSVYIGTALPYSLSYDLNKMDKHIAFNKLAPGSYTYKVTASNSTHDEMVLTEQSFSVGSKQNADDVITITGGTTIPSEMQKGIPVIITGTLSSASSNITYVSAGIYDSEGNRVSGSEMEPNAKTFDLNTVDELLTFDKLAAGSYTYRVTVSNGSNANYVIVSQSFTIVEKLSTEDTLTLESGTEVPDTLAQGTVLPVQGIVSSAVSEITYLAVGIYDESNNLATGKTIAPKAKTYDLSGLDGVVSFEKLQPGTYTYTIVATNAANANFTLFSKRFTVSAGDIPAETDALSITGGTEIPQNLTKGKIVNIRGIVTSGSSGIISLTAGVYDETGKMLTGKTVAPQAKSYDLQNLDDDIAFDSLEAGSYSYTVTATNAVNTNVKLVDQKFTIGLSAQASADKLSVSGATEVPDTIAAGALLTVTGTVTSAVSNITALTVGVYDMSGTFVTGRTIAPNAKSYDLKKLDDYVQFNKLPVGKYLFAVIASNAANTNFALVNKQFTVGNGGTTTTPAEDKLTITGGTEIPDTIAVGKALTITGTVTSATTNITSLTAGVYDENGKFVTGRTINPNAKTYDLKKLDNYIEFNKLAAGKYIYAVIATNSGNTNFALVNKQFTVGNGGTTTTPPSTGPQDPPAEVDDKLTISGSTNVPDTIAVGKALSITGTVTSVSSNITSLTAGVFDASGKLVTGKTVAPNAKTYNLKSLDNDIVFNRLAAGTYTYKVVATNAANSDTALVSKVFTVGNGNTGTVTAPSTDDKLTITDGTNVPDTIAVGKALSITGTVTSASSNITSLTAGVFDASGNLVTGKTVAPNAKTYNLKNLDNDIVFNRLAAGTYTYKVIATNAANSSVALVSKSFTVGNGGTTTTPSTDDKLTITDGTNVPDTIAVGKALSITGTVTSASSNITSLTAGVFDASGNLVTGKTVAPNAKTYNLKNLDNDIVFNRLAAGTYTYKVIATNAANNNVALVSKSFTVGNGGTTTTPSTDDKLTITGGTNVPDTIAVGKALNVTGTVTSASSNITALTVGVYNTSGKFVTGRTIAPNAKSYDLSKLDRYVEFNKLPAGSYVYAVIASNAANSNYAIVKKQFTVGNGGGTTSTPSTDDKMTLTGGTVIPDTLAKGKALSVTGTINSASSNITSLTVGVYENSTGKFVTGRTIAPNAKSYDLKKLDNYIEFNKLAAGTYTYAVIATNASNSNSAVYTKQFTVGGSGTTSTPSNSSDNLTISGGTEVPATLAKGRALSVKGVVTSASSNITALTVGVYSTSGAFVTGRTIAPNAKSYDLKKLDNYVEFNKLGAGSYVYAVIATNAGNTNFALVNKSFTVTGDGSGTASDPITISGGTVVPGTVTKGKGVTVRGTVTSATSNITSLTAGVYDASGKLVTGTTVNPGAKSYNVNKLDSQIRFDQLAAGTYYYKVVATNSANSGYTVVNQSFTVR